MPINQQFVIDKSSANECVVLQPDTPLVICAKSQQHTQFQNTEELTAKNVKSQAFKTGLHKLMIDVTMAISIHVYCMSWYHTAIAALKLSCVPGSAVDWHKDRTATIFGITKFSHTFLFMI